MFFGVLFFLVAGCNQNLMPIREGGVGNLEHSDSIIGGSKVKVSDTAAQSTVAIYIYKYNKLRQHCSGTLIDKQIVLTAAHCIEDHAKKNNMTVDQFIKQIRIGFGLPVVDSLKNKNIKIIRAEKAIVHEQYVVDQIPSSGEFYDIALIKLASPSPKNFKPVRLAESKDLYVGGAIVVAGYGVIDRQEQPTTTLKMVNLEVGNTEQSKTQFSYDTNKNIGFSSGDSGGPAYVENQDGGYSVLGIVSWNLSFALSFGYFSWIDTGVLTNVPYFADWIKENSEKLLLQ